MRRQSMGYFEPADSGRRTRRALRKPPADYSAAVTKAAGGDLASEMPPKRPTRRAGTFGCSSTATEPRPGFCVSRTRSLPSGLGAEGTYIGSDVFSGGSFVYDPWVSISPERSPIPTCCIAGVIGSGKSSTAKALITRSMALAPSAYVPCDPKGEWTGVAEAVGGAVIKLRPGMPTPAESTGCRRRPDAVGPTSGSASLGAPSRAPGHAGRVHPRPNRQRA